MGWLSTKEAKSGQNCQDLLPSFRQRVFLCVFEHVMNLGASFLQVRPIKVVGWVSSILPALLNFGNCSEASYLRSRYYTLTSHSYHFLHSEISWENHWFRLLHSTNGPISGENFPFWQHQKFKFVLVKWKLSFRASETKEGFTVLKKVKRFSCLHFPCSFVVCDLWAGRIFKLVYEAKFEAYFRHFLIRDLVRLSSTKCIFWCIKKSLFWLPENSIRNSLKHDKFSY